MYVKPYPKDNEPRTMGLDPELVAQLVTWIREHELGAHDLLVATRGGTPISRNTFRARIRAPAVAAPGSTSTCASTASATPTHPGSSPADPTSSP
jgi:hypothetical protein